MLVQQSPYINHHAQLEALARGMCSIYEEPMETEKLSGLRLLILDDDRNTRDMLSELLQLYGAQVRTAASVADGLKILQSWRPGLIVSDLGMPDADGFDFIRELRELSPERGGETLAIALTGYGRPEDRARALSAGYQMFVAKPVDLEELINVIERLSQPG